MKKQLSILVTLSMVIFFVISIFPGAALVECSEIINWFVVQDRTYGSDDNFTRVLVEFRESLPTSTITAIRLYDPDDEVVTDVTLESSVLSTVWSAGTNYSWNGSAPDSDQYWDWTSMISNGWRFSYYFGWRLYDYEIEVGEPGQEYEIQIDLQNGTTLTETFKFTGYVDLPIVSLVKGKARPKDDSTKQLDAQFLEDGSFILRWKAAEVTTDISNVRTHVFITLQEIQESYPYDVEVYVVQPVHVGMLILSPEALEFFQCDPDYHGYLAFSINTRLVNNTVRTYSYRHKYYFENTPSCP